MSNAALAVGMAIGGIFILMIAGVVTLICVLNKRSPRRPAVDSKIIARTKHVKKGTESIKRKAEKLKADRSNSSCCVFMACCGGGRSDGPLPDPPFGVEVQDPTSSEITVIWNEPEAESQAVPILGYSIYKRLQSNPDDWTKVGKVTVEELEFRIKNLVPNKRYVFGVSSKGKSGESTIVETQPTALKKDPVRPGAPTELDVTKTTSSSMTLSWKPPRKGGYSRIHTYYIMMKDCDCNADWTHLTSLPAFDKFMDYKVIGLKPTHQYRFRVNAQNAAGLGPYAETVTHETTEKEPEPPGHPKGPIKYARMSHNSITLSWRPPEKDGGKPVSGFAVEYKEKNGKWWQKAGVCEADKTRLTVPRLQENSEYIFRVIAMNIVGNSKPLVGAKVKTKLLEIPISRSSFRLSSREEASRDSSRGKPSTRGTDTNKDIGKDTTQAVADLEENAPQTTSNPEGIDPQLEADPFVPKSDFFTYDETNSGNISSRHNENKTSHSQFSPLPAPPPSQPKKRSGAAQIGPKVRHSNLSPLPRPESQQNANHMVGQSGSSYAESDYNDDKNDINDDGNTYHNVPDHDEGLETNDRGNVPKDSESIGHTSSILIKDRELNKSGGVVRHQPTPSNIAYSHSRF